MNFRTCFLTSIAGIIFTCGSILVVAQKDGHAIETRIIPQLVQDRSPLKSVAARFQQVYGGVVTYEDPILVAPADLEPFDGRLSSPMVPKRLSFRIPIDTAQEPQLALAVHATLEAYNRDAGGPRFRMLTSKLGIHLVPDQVRNAQGQFAPAKNPLDQPIFVPSEERTVKEHLAAIEQAVERAAGIRYFQWVAARVGGQRDDLGAYFGSQGKFVWGTQGQEVARVALIHFLDLSETSFSWNVGCGPDPKSSGVLCGMVLSPVVVPFTQLDGTVVLRTRSQDRCPKCTPAAPAKPQ